MQYLKKDVFEHKSLINEHKSIFVNFYNENSIKLNHFFFLPSILYQILLSLTNSHKSIFASHTKTK